MLTGKTDYRGDWSVLTHCIKCVLNRVLPLCWDYFSMWHTSLKNLPCKLLFKQPQNRNVPSGSEFLNKKETELATLTEHSFFAVNSCEYLKVNWGEIATEIFDLIITVSFSYRDSPQVTLFSASQMAQPGNKSFAIASHLVCKMVSQLVHKEHKGRTQTQWKEETG